jgi:hypothetical protein
MRSIPSAILLTLATTALLCADTRTNPPTVQSYEPKAVTRGLATKIKVKGINLGGARSVVFDDPSIHAKVLHVNHLGDFIGTFIGSNGTPSTIDRGAPAPLEEVTIEVEAAGETRIGSARFRLLTDAGTTNASTVSVEPFFGSRSEIEPNDGIPEVLLQDPYVFPPTIITGRINKPGDEDYLPFTGVSGKEMVFHVSAADIGSRLRWQLELYDATGQRLAQRSILDGPLPVLAYRIPSDGKYVLKISDIEWGGGEDHFYRVKIGDYPYLTGVYPLGVPRDATTEVSLRGYNLGDQRKVAVDGKPTYEAVAHADLQPELETGEPQNHIELAVGEFPEVEEQESGADIASAMHVDVPSTVNGRVSGFTDEGRKADEDYYRFHARKGEHYVIEVEARRLGSPLDSVIEILDAKGQLVSQATARAEVATRIVLADRPSSSANLRLEDLTHFEVGDYVYVGNEVLRVRELPRGPDSDYFFDAFNGERIGFFNTTPEAVAIDTPAYKVTIHPPNTKFPPNGLPVIQLAYRNDDGGPGYGKDSLLNFVAPADGDYLVHLRDLRGFQGEDFAYRLTVREARPDFRLSLNPPNPNIPRGGHFAVTVDALRIDGFDGPIAVEAKNLPPGVTATSETIAAGETSTTLVLSASETTHLEAPAPLDLSGNASIHGQAVERQADPDDRLHLIAVAGPPDIALQIENPEVTLEAGGTVQVAVSVDRKNGFKGRVPVSVLNLPFGVKVTDIGLNGVLITEEQTRRVFTLQALPWVEPTERLVAVSGQVETRSPLRAEYAAKPFKLKIVPGQTQRAATGEPRSAGATAATKR